MTFDSFFGSKKSLIVIFVVIFVKKFVIFYFNLQDSLIYKKYRLTFC
jgi:hypothetical protein